MNTQADYLAMLARLKKNRIREQPAAEDAVERESDLHDTIIYECRKRGWICFTGSMSHRTKRNLGEPDFCIVADGGRVFFIEAKGRNGKLTTEQAATIAWLKKLGASAHVVDSMQAVLAIFES